MAKRTDGKTKLTPEIRQRLVEAAKQAGETAAQIGTQDRTLETESGAVPWKEPKTYLPKSRRAFF